MISKKIINLEVFKPDDYRPIPQIEKYRIALRIVSEVIKLANRFDGCSRIKIQVEIEGCGNA